MVIQSYYSPSYGQVLFKVCCKLLCNIPLFKPTILHVFYLMMGLKSPLQFWFLQQVMSLGIGNTGGKMSFRCYQSHNFGFLIHGRTTVSMVNNSLPKNWEPIISDHFGYHPKSILCSPGTSLSYSKINGRWRNLSYLTL